MLVNSAKPDRNLTLFRKNRLEWSLESGTLPKNIPFVFDRMLGIYDGTTGLEYTLVPFFLSLRWQVTNPSGPWLFHGNWEFSFTGAYTMIPRGPETRYFAYIMGIRRNFVRPRWPVIPFFEGRVGMGDINAKEPLGFNWAKGQDLTFTVMLDAGFRYNFTPQYAISGGVAYMHISNMYLSEPRYPNYGINVYGPMFGLYREWGRGARRGVAKSNNDSRQSAHMESRTACSAPPCMASKSGN